MSSSTTTPPTNTRRPENGSPGIRGSSSTSPSRSWLNAVETFFEQFTRWRLKRGVSQSIVDLQAAINRFVAETNHDPKPFVWTADPHNIIAAVKRGRQVLNSIH